VEDDREDRLERLVRDAYQRTPSASADLHARIQRGLDEHDAAIHRMTVWSWWWRPDALRLAPAAIVAVACLLVGGGAWMGSAVHGRASGRGSSATHRPPGSPARTAGVSASQTPACEVAFMLVAPGVTRVALVGEFNDWDPLATPLVRVGRDGPWVATVALPPGRHIYSFVLDGSRWMSDPGAPLAPDDAFGAPNSVVVVGPEGPL